MQYGLALTSHFEIETLFSFELKIPRRKFVYLLLDKIRPDFVKQYRQQLPVYHSYWGEQTLETLGYKRCLQIRSTKT